MTHQLACDIGRCDTTDEETISVHFISPGSRERRRLCTVCYERLRNFAVGGLSPAPPSQTEGTVMMFFTSRLHLELFLRALQPAMTA